MRKVGFIGMRGMVGSVLMERMLFEKDFQNFTPVFFSTSKIGASVEHFKIASALYEDAHDIAKLKNMDILVSCQGGFYTEKMFLKLREEGWQGYWIDSASTLRLNNDSIIVLDPVNLAVITQGLKRGIKNYIGGNCTTSLLLMGIGSLIQAGLVEWVSVNTYQAVSGAGAQFVQEFLAQTKNLSTETLFDIENPTCDIFSLDKKITAFLNTGSYPKAKTLAPLALNIIPWIDNDLGNGMSREEAKIQLEANKILDTKEEQIHIDGICVRVGAMRCHSEALTVKLKQNLPLSEIEKIIKTNPWAKVVSNTKADTLAELTPASVSAKLEVRVGRIRKMQLGDSYFSAMIIGDQLLWGAAEPLRRVLKIIINAA